MLGGIFSRARHRCRTWSQSAAPGLVLVPAGLIAAGLLLPDLALLCGGALLSARAFDAWMTLCRPWEPWRAAVRCATAGLAFVVLGGLVLLVVAMAARGSWMPINPARFSVAAVVMAWAFVALIAAPAAGELELTIVAVIGAVALSLAAVGWQAPASAMRIAGVGSGLVLMGRGWHLMRHVCSAFLRMDRRH